MTIRVMIVDDQPMIRAGFRALLSTADEIDIDVVADAADGAAAIDLARRELVDVVLMDVRMPGMDGLEATRRICSDENLSGVRVLILTTFELDEYVFEALRAGASGFLSKSVGLADLVSAIRTVAAGESLLSPSATRALINAFLTVPPAASGAKEHHPGLAHLTERETEVVKLVGEGLSNAEIATRFAISPLTVKTHVNRAMMKLDLRDRSQLVVVAYQEGLVPNTTASSGPPSRPTATLPERRDW